MKIYTRTGDTGKTSLFGGRRVAKHHIRLEAYGTVDELNAVLGFVLSQEPAPVVASAIQRVQHELFVLGADLATPAEVTNKHVQRVPASAVTRLEQEIDGWDVELPALQVFILPGGHPAAAALHVARTVCRRAERATTLLADQETINEFALQYLNRLSDWLFVLARMQNHLQGIVDTPWQNNPTNEEAP